MALYVQTMQRVRRGARAASSDGSNHDDNCFCFVVQEHMGHNP